MQKITFDDAYYTCNLHEQTAAALWHADIQTLKECFRIERERRPYPTLWQIVKHLFEKATR